MLFFIRWGSSSQTGGAQEPPPPVWEEDPHDSSFREAFHLSESERSGGRSVTPGEEDDDHVPDPDLLRAEVESKEELPAVDSSGDLLSVAEDRLEKAMELRPPTPEHLKHCKGLVSYGAKWIRCRDDDAIPTRVLDMIRGLARGQCDRMDWALRELILLLALDVATALRQLEKFSGEEGVVGKRRDDVVDRGEDNRDRTTMEVLDGPHQHEDQGAGAAATRADEGVGSTVDDSDRNLRAEADRNKNLWPSVFELMTAGRDSGHLFLMDCLRARFGRSGVDGLVAHELETYEAAGRSRAEKYGVKPTFGDEDERGRPSIDYHGDETAQETLEYYWDKGREESESGKLPKIDGGVCRDCEAGVWWRGKGWGGPSVGGTSVGATPASWVGFDPTIDRSVLFRAAVVYVVINFNNNGPTILKDLLLALQCSAKYLKFPPQAYDIVVLHHGFSLDELRWLYRNRPRPYGLPRML